MTETVLIVDDTRVNRTRLRRILEIEGFDCLEADSGEAGLEIANAREPDIVLLDVMMPGADGYEVCERLKEQSRFASLPVIFLSARSDTESKVRGLDLGAADYITKPFQSPEVLARVRSQLKIRALTRNLEIAHRHLLSQKERLDEDLRAAADIQKSLIPSTAPSIPGVELAWRFIPCEEIGGDIFNVVPLDDVHWAFYMVDVSGHGVPSAMLTVSVSQCLAGASGSLLKETLEEAPYYRIREPDEVLRSLDVAFPMERFDKYFTMFYGVLDTRSGRLAYSSAAHPMPFLLRGSGGDRLLEAGGSIIGFGGAIPFEPGEVRLEPGDRLFVYTDGVPESQNHAEECFGEEALHRVLRSARHGSLDEACERVVEEIRRHGAEPFAQDDITLLAIEFRGPEVGMSREEGTGRRRRSPGVESGV